MHGGWALGGAAVGLLAGARLRPTVVRLSVPAGAPAHTAGASPPPATLELTTAVLLGLVAGVVGGRAELVAFGWLAVVGVALAAVDLAVRRLPDRLVLPGYPVVLAALAVAAAIDRDPARLLRAVAAGLAVGGCYLLLALLRPGQLGAGDLKLSGLLGLTLGWLGWVAVLRGTLLGFVLFSLWGLALLAARRARLRTDLPFGPFMLAGVFLTLLLGPGLPAS